MKHIGCLIFVLTFGGTALSASVHPKLQDPISQAWVQFWETRFAPDPVVPETIEAQEERKREEMMDEYTSTLSGKIQSLQQETGEKYPVLRCAKIPLSVWFFLHSTHAVILEKAFRHLIECGQPDSFRSIPILYSSRVLLKGTRFEKVQEEPETTK